MCKIERERGYTQGEKECVCEEDKQGKIERRRKSVRACVCVWAPLYTALGAKTLEIALIWILSVSSNHNHVTASPTAAHCLIHSAETSPGISLYTIDNL